MVNKEIKKNYFVLLYLPVCQIGYTSYVALPVFLLHKGVSFVSVRLALLSVVAMETVLSHNEMMN